MEMGNFDAICTALCLESSCPDISMYQKAMVNVVSLLRKGGKFVIVGIINQQFYTVGTEKFHVLQLTKQDVFNAVDKAGLKVVETLEHDTPLDWDTAPYDGLVVILAEKI